MIRPWPAEIRNTISTGIDISAAPDGVGASPAAVGMRIAERIRIKLGTTPWDWNGRHWPLSE